MYSRAIFPTPKDEKRKTHFKMTPLNAYSEVSSGARGLTFNLNLDLHSYFVYINSECSGESERLFRLLPAFTARHCDGCQILICWLKGPLTVVMGITVYRCL